MDQLTGKILITGGTGTLGKALLERAHEESWDVNFTVLSRGEIAQRKLKAQYPNVQFVIGDIRNYEQLANLCVGHDTIVHAAAYKFIDTGEHNAQEVNDINVMGSQNVCVAAVRAGIKMVIGISTDKAVKPVNVYGASKLMMEKIFQNMAVLAPQTKFVLTRYGNVLESTGSVVEIWRKQYDDLGQVSMTHPEMTRFWLSPKQAVDIILEVTYARSGEIVIPKLPGMGIMDMAFALFPNAEVLTTGLRPGEKLHESLLCAEESYWDNSVPNSTRFMLQPMYTPPITKDQKEWTSDTAPQLTEEQLKDLLNE